MRLLIFFLTLFSLNIISAQTWSYKSGGNAFDGKYKAATVKGRATNYPYHEPLLVINLFNEESLNFYLSGAGYYGSSSDVEVLWIFKNEPKIKYKSEGITKSDNGKILFFNGFRNTSSSDYLTDLEFIEKLKSASKVDVRVISDYGKNDIGFSLYGSTKAINYVISKKYKDKRKAEYEAYKKELFERIDKEIETNARISKLLLEADVLTNELEGVLDRIESTFDIYDLNMNDIVSLSFDITKYSIDLNLFDSNNNLIKELTIIDYYMPKTYEKMKSEKAAKEAAEEEAKEKAKEEAIKKAKEQAKKEADEANEKISNLLASFGLSNDEKESIVSSLKKTSYVLKKLKTCDSISILNDDSMSKNEARMLLITRANKHNKIEPWEGYRITIPDSTLNRIVTTRKEYNSNRVSGLIKKYGLTEKEEESIMPNLINLIEIYCYRNIYAVSEINLKTSKETYKQHKIIAELKKKDGEIIEEKISPNPASLFRKIAKKIKNI